MNQIFGIHIFLSAVIESGDNKRNDDQAACNQINVQTNEVRDFGPSDLIKRSSRFFLKHRDRLQRNQHII